MVLKRHLREEDEEGSRLPSRQRRLVSTLFKGVSYGPTLQESISCLEPMIRKIVQEEVNRVIDPLLRSSVNQVCIARRLQLQFRCNLPHTLFTNSRVLSQDRCPVTIVLNDPISKEIVTTGPLSSLRVTIVVLDGDFRPDNRGDWTAEEFARKIVKNREGKRPLVTGELTVVLQNGVGSIDNINFTDNSSWIRSGKFRLGAKVRNSSAELSSVKEAMSNAFKVKDHRGESYKKHHPPSLDDEVWRLEKIAKDGPSHKRLAQVGIFCVKDFLKLYFTDQFTLRAILHKSTNRTWETIIGHARTCNLDHKKYAYMTSQGSRLFFNSVYEVIGVTFDGHSNNYLSLNSLDTYQMNMVEHLKLQAYKNLSEWVTVCDPSISGYPVILESPSPDSSTNPYLGLHGVNFREQEMNSYHHPTMSPPYNTELEQDNCSFEMGESSNSVHGFDNVYLGEHDNNYLGPQLWADDIHEIGNHEIGIIWSNSGILRPKARWCKVLVVVKWRILVRRNVAERKWRRSYGYV